METVTLIGTGYVLIAIFRTLRHIERRFRAAWHCTEGRKGKEAARSGKERKYFVIHRLGKIRKLGRFLT
jgi:hypothetical protein